MVTIEGLENGTYNICAEKDGKKTTVLVTVSGRDVDISGDSIVLRANNNVVVTGAKASAENAVDTSGVKVAGVDELAKNTAAENATYRMQIDGKNYEDRYDGAYPIVTTVTPDSAQLVAHLIPQEYLELIDSDNRFIIAAMRYIPSEEEKESHVAFTVKALKAVSDGGEDAVDYHALTPTKTRGGVEPGGGVLSFVLEEVDGEPIVRIEWLYVDPKHRNCGLVNVLMMQMLYMLRDYHPAAVVADIDQDALVGDGEPRPVSDTDDEPILKTFNVSLYDEDYDPQKDFSPLVYFLTSWKFEAEVRMGDEAYFRISDLQMPDKDPAQRWKPKSIRNLSETELQQLVERIVGRNAGHYDAAHPEAGSMRYDQDVSCYIMENGEAAGLLLARKNYKGELVFDMVSAVDPTEEKLAGMLSYALYGAAAKYGRDTLVSTPIHQEMTLDLFERYTREPGYRVNVSAALIEPVADITTEEWDAFVDALQGASDEDLQELAKDLGAAAIEDE